MLFGPFRSLSVLFGPFRCLGRPHRTKELISNSTPSSSYAGCQKLESASSNDKTKRPMNAFFLYSTFQRKKQSQDKTLAAHQNDVCRSFGATWKQLSKEEKQPFYDEAKRLAAEHKRLNPDYKYNPRRKSVQQTQAMSNGKRQQSTDTPHSIASMERAHPSFSDHNRCIVVVAPGASTLLHSQPIQLTSLVGSTPLRNDVGVFAARTADVAYDTNSTNNTNNRFGGGNSSTLLPDWSFPGTYNVCGTPAEFASNVFGTYDIPENENDISE